MSKFFYVLIFNVWGRSSLGQASKLLIRLRNASQTNSLWKQTVPPPLLYCVAILLMSPIQTYFNLSLSSALFGCFLISLLIAHFEWSWVVVKAVSELDLKSIESMF